MFCKIGAVITTYKPDDGFIQRIDVLKSACERVIVVDNTPGGHKFAEPVGFVLLQDGTNKGLGAALNIGIQEARRSGCNRILLLDQDSSPSLEFVERMSKAYDEISQLHGDRVCIGPSHMDDMLERGRPVFLPGTGWQEVSCLATSGMMFSLDMLGVRDAFSLDLFLDFVDFDWCWRMRKNGWRIFRLSSVRMPHRLGLAQRKFLIVKYHVPAPYRHYYQFRDTLRLISKSHTPFYAKFRLFLILLPKLILFPFLLDSGTQRLKWMLLGIRDAVYNRGGIGAGAAVLQVNSRKAEFLSTTG